MFHQRLTLERRAFEFSLSRCHIVFHPPRPSFSQFAFHFFLFTLIIFCLRLTFTPKSDRFEQPHAMAACLSIDAQCFWRYPLIAWFGIVRAAPFIGFVHRCWFLVFFSCSRYFRNVFEAGEELAILYSSWVISLPVRSFFSACSPPFWKRRAECSNP